jgi:hypothetical protein
MVRLTKNTWLSATAIRRLPIGSQSFLKKTSTRLYGLGVGVQPLPGINSRLPGSVLEQPAATSVSPNNKISQIFAI